MEAVIGAFNQEKALVVVVIVKTYGSFAALQTLHIYRRSSVVFRTVTRGQKSVGVSAWRHIYFTLTHYTICLCSEAWETIRHQHTQRPGHEITHRRQQIVSYEQFFCNIHSHL